MPLGPDGTRAGEKSDTKMSRRQIFHLIEPLTINKMLITQEAHTMNIYQLCGPQEHDDNDNVTSGECCAMSKLTSYIAVSLMLRHVTFYIATS